MNSKNKKSIDSDDPALTYKPFHGAAVVAVILALISFLSIAFPVLMIFSAAAALFAVFAIVKINRSSQFSGQRVAQFALFLAAVASTTTLMHTYGRSWYTGRTALQHSQTLMKLIMDGRYPEAWEYGTRADGRQPEGTDLVEFYNRFDRVPGMIAPPAVLFRTWMGVPPLSLINKDQRNGKMEFLGFKRYPREHPQFESVGCDYRYTPASGDIEASVFRVIMLRRDYAEPLGVQWRFRRFDILSGPEQTEAVRILGPPTGEEDDKKNPGEAK